MQNPAGSATQRLKRLVQRRAPADAPGAPPLDAVVEPETLAILDACAPHTMASRERLIANMDAVEYVVRRGVPGAIVECGVWRGGSVLAMVRKLIDLGVTDREIWLYDTFEGMTEPTELDISRFSAPAAEEWQKAVGASDKPWGHWFSTESFSEASVRSLILDTGYPEDLVRLVVGPVEETLPGEVPEAVALLRLDTDWYESTAHEMEHLYPALSTGGVLIIDDYGHWDGARRAVDEYLDRVGDRLLLQRTDYTARMAVKA